MRGGEREEGRATPVDKRFSGDEQEEGKEGVTFKDDGKTFFSSPPSLSLYRSLAPTLSTSITLCRSLARSSKPPTRSLPGSLSHAHWLFRWPSLSDSAPSSSGHCIFVERETLDSPLTGVGISEVCCFRGVC